MARPPRCRVLEHELDMNWTRVLLLACGAILVWLQWQYWLGEDGHLALRSRQAEAERQREIIDGLREQNRELEVEALDLKHGIEAVEERAREELGMIREGETFYIVVD